MDEAQIVHIHNELSGYGCLTLWSYRRDANCQKISDIVVVEETEAILCISQTFENRHDGAYSQLGVPCLII
jgi:hypothetical protein